MTTDGKVETRGGVRPGAGRPPGSRDTLSQAQAKELLEIARLRAIKEKKTVGEVILDVVYDESCPRRDRLAACKLWMDITVVKIPEGSEGDKLLGPAIYLPAHRPAFDVIEGGKAA